VGLWLEAPADLLETRIAARANDASDATVEVLRAQLGYPVGPVDWTRIDAAASASEICDRALAVLGT
jgi:predicted kinase